LVAVFVVLGGCGRLDAEPARDAPAAAGGVQLGLVIADGVDIDEVQYRVEVPGFDALTGTLPVAESGWLGTILGVPAAPGVHIFLTADNGQGVHCEGDGEVKVTASQTTEVVIALQCRLPDDSVPGEGTIDVGAGFNICPRVTSIQHLITGVSEAGERVAGLFMVHTEDLDGDAVSVALDAPAADFSELIPAEDSAYVHGITYCCGSAEEERFTVTVDDGRGCTHSKDMLFPCQQPCRELLSPESAR
jgi:hypothetical protein